MPIRRATLFNLFAIGLLLGLAALGFASVRPPGSAAVLSADSTLSPAPYPGDLSSPELPTSAILTDTLTLTATATLTLTPTLVVSPTALASPTAISVTVVPIPTAISPLSATATLAAISATATLTARAPLTDTLAWLWWEGSRDYLTEQQLNSVRGGSGAIIWVDGGPVMRLDRAGGQHPVATNVIRTVPRPGQAPLLITVPYPTGSFTITDPLSGVSVPVDIGQTADISGTIAEPPWVTNDSKSLDDISLSPDGALLAYSFSAYDALDRMVRYDDEIALTDLRTGQSRTLYPGVSILDRTHVAERPYRWVIGWRDHTLYGAWEDGDTTAIWSFNSDTGAHDEHAWDAPAGGALVGATSDWIIYSLPTDAEGLRDYWFMPWDGEPRPLGRYETGLTFAVSPAPPWRIAFITPPRQPGAPEPQDRKLLLGDLAGDFSPRVISDSLSLYSSVGWLSERYLRVHQYQYENDYMSLLDGVTGVLLAQIPFDSWGGSAQATGPDDRVLWTLGDCSEHGRTEQPMFYLEVLEPKQATPERLELGPAPVEPSSWVDCVPPRIVYVPEAR